MNVEAKDAGDASYVETFNIITGTNANGNNQQPLPGLNGDDVIYADQGNDFIFAGSGDDTIFAQDGQDQLHGGAGSDRLWGGAGNDMFVFDSALGTNNVDLIGDFTNAGGGNNDAIWLDDLVFTALSMGNLSGNDFRAGANAVVVLDATDRIIHDTSTGALSYDADGSGSGVAVQFAQLQIGASLNAGDFLVI